LKIIINKNK